MPQQASTALRQAWAAALIATVGNLGLLRIYTGVKPLTVDTAISGQVKVYEFQLAAPFAPAALLGVILPTLPNVTSALANGQPCTFYQVCNTGGTPVYQGDVVNTGDGLVLNLGDPFVLAGQPGTVDQWTVTMAGA